MTDKDNAMVNEPLLEALNDGLLEMRAQSLRDEQRLGLALGAGIAAASAGAVLWAVITVFTEHQIGFMAIGVGFLVGYAVRFAGKGIDKSFGVVGASCSLVGCLVGNLLSACYFLADGQNVMLSDVMSALNPSLALELLTLTFNPMDLLFYGIAIYEGYRLSMNAVSLKPV